MRDKNDRVASEPSCDIILNKYLEKNNKELKAMISCLLCDI